MCYCSTSSWHCLLWLFSFSELFCILWLSTFTRTTTMRWWSTRHLGLRCTSILEQTGWSGTRMWRRWLKCCVRKVWQLKVSISSPQPMWVYTETVQRTIPAGAGRFWPTAWVLQRRPWLKKRLQVQHWLYSFRPAYTINVYVHQQLYLWNKSTAV